MRLDTKSDTRRKMGVVVIEGKSHPVFQGLNVIGRSEAATVTIRKVEVSKQHAFIVVVKESEHYLSDFKSSNGTFLNESQLNPLMLYDIPSDAEIKFGNVSAKYLKYPQEQSHNQLECHSPRNTENYFDDDFSFDDITTQMISKESENTVLKNPDSIHDMPTQMLYQKNSSHCSISIHEAETQKVDICILKEDGKSPSINDMPTQLLNDTEKDDTTIIDETILTDEVSEMNTTNTSQYSDTELKLQVTQLKHRKLKPISDSEEISNTDSSDQIITFKKKKIQVIQSDPETDIEDDEILSDSAADIEDSISINNEVQIPSKKVVAMLSSNVACLDSDSDIDDFECNTQANLQSEVNDESQDIIPSTQFSEECDNQTSTLTSTQNEELLALAVENGINPDGEYNNNINSVNIRKSLHLEETKSIRIDAMKPTQILPETDLIETKESVHKENVETVSLETQSVTEITQKNNVLDACNEIFMLPTQVMISRNLQNSISSNELETVPKDINDDIFMQPTQVIEPIKTVPKVDIVQAMGVLEPVVKEKEQCTLKNMQTNNDIYLLPTQVTDMNDDIFMQPTQVIEQIETEQKVTKVDVKSIGDLESVVEVKDQCSLKKMQTNNDIYSIPTQVTDMNDDIFMQPTQVIEQIETEQKVTKVDVQAIRVLESVVEVKGQCSLKMQTDTDIFLHPTQVAEFDDVYMQSTQPLSTNVQQSETFLQPTQPLIATRENYIFDKPKTVLSKSKVANQELNEMYLQPTQQLVATKPTTTDSEDCIENKLEALFASQNATATTNVESQLEVTFVSQNISLNVDVSDRPLNPLLNEFNSETNTLEDSTDFISNSSIGGNTTQSFEEKSLPSETKLEQHLKNLSKNVQQIETDIQLSTTKDGVVKEPETASSKVADSQEEIENKLQRMFASQDSLQAPQTNLKKQLRNVSVNDEKNINKHALKRNSPESKNRNKKLRSTKIIEEDKDQEKSTVQLDDVHSLKEEADTEVKHASPRLRKSMRNVKTTSAKEKRNQSLQKLTKRNKVTKSEDNHLKTTIPSDDSKAVKQHEEISDTKGSSTSMEEHIKISSANGEKSKNKQKLKDHSTSKNSIDQKLLINRASSSDEDSTKFDVTKEVDTLEIKDVSVERQTRGKAKGTHTVDKNTKTKTNEDVSDRINVNVLDSTISTRPKRNTKLPAKLRTENEPIPEKVDAKLKEDHFQINTSKLNPDTHNKVKSVKSNTKVINTPSSKRSHNGGSKIEELDSSNSEDSFSSKSLKRHNKRDTCLDMASSPSKKLKQSILQTDKSADLTSLISTPERSRRKLKPKVVFTMLDSPELESIIRNLGGTIVDSIESCTVLVTGSLKRSLKLLSAVGLGKPICSPNWINECKKANQFLDPWHFILEDKEAESRWKLSLKESLKRSKTQKLLEGYIVYVMVTTAVDVLKAAIESCGGKCVTKATGKNSNEELIIIANPENKTKYSRFLKKKPPTQVLLPEAIFDGVLRQELHFEQHSVI